MPSSHTPKDVAEFMARRLSEQKELVQEDIVFDIERQFGKEFVYENENGNSAIDKKVLAEFRKLTPDAVWERGTRSWRPREKFDTPGSRDQE